MKKALAFVIFFLPALALAAPTQKTTRKKARGVATTPTSETRTAAPAASSAGSANLKGLSVFVSLDMTDSVDFERSAQGQVESGTFSGERAFGFGGEYQFKAFENGIGLHAGGSYELARPLANTKIGAATQNFPGSKPEIQLWTAYGQLSAFLTPEVGFIGGINYAVPQVRNVPDGTWRGKIGYQLGATYRHSANFAVDGLYRTLNFHGSSESDGVSTNYSNVGVSGFTFRGRYIF